eukprot:EG_transcript_6828
MELADAQALQLVSHTMGLLVLADKELASQSLAISGRLAELHAKDPAMLQPLVDPVVAKSLREDRLVPEGCIPLLPFRTASDHNCLCHGAAIAMWGHEDKQLVLRTAVHHNMEGPGEGANYFKEQWMHTALERDLLAFGIEIERSSDEWAREWQEELNVVKDTSRSLTEIHVFVLAHVIRRPIIVYSPGFCKDVNGKDLAPIYFGGVYLPVLLAPEDRPSRCPLLMVYSQSHFTALVPVAGAKAAGGALEVPLVDAKGQPLPIHYVDQTFFAPGSKGWRDLLQNYLDLPAAESGPVTARLCNDRPCSYGAQLLKAAEAAAAADSPPPVLMPAVKCPLLNLEALNAIPMVAEVEDDCPSDRSPHSPGETEPEPLLRPSSLTSHPPIRRGQTFAHFSPRMRTKAKGLDLPPRPNGSPSRNTLDGSRGGQPGKSPQRPNSPQTLAPAPLAPSPRNSTKSPVPLLQIPLPVSGPGSARSPPAPPSHPGNGLPPASPKTSGGRSPRPSTVLTGPTSPPALERHVSGRGPLVGAGPLSPNRLTSMPQPKTRTPPSPGQRREDSTEPPLQRACNSPALAMSPPTMPALLLSPKKLATLNLSFNGTRTPLSARTSNSTP